MNYFLHIAQTYKSFLASIRHWSTLKMAYEGNAIWLKGFSEEQVTSITVKSIPHKQLYKEQDGQLFPLGSLLPSKNVPSLLWTPIERALPVQLPSKQSNLETPLANIQMELVPAEKEEKVIALGVELPVLANYIEKAAAHRLQSLRWLVINRQQALIIGEPLLALPGKVYWQQEDFLIPAGWQFKLYALVPAFNRLLNFERNQLLIWNENGTYYPIDKNQLQTLSIGSFRQTFQQILAMM